MKDEIKEILEDVKRHLDYVETTKQFSIRDKEIKAMYDYITNLQTIEQQYSAILSENAELENKTTNLQKENKQLKERIDKAIEYIKENSYFEGNVVKTMIYQDYSKYILEILEGNNNE